MELKTRVIHARYDGNLRLIEITRNDGSPVFTLQIGSHELPFLDQPTAFGTFNKICALIDKAQDSTFSG